ncbi:MAG: hydantoinase/oxoprolinase family protein, partial [Sphingomicrobium sp.]
MAPHLLDGAVATSWTFAIDRGGTFTDVIATQSDGEMRVEKLLSDNQRQYPDAALEGIRRVIDGEGGTVGEVRMGTTVATNALLERKGERCALAITRGFGDSLRIGNQARPDIFARHIVLPDMLYAEAVEINERVGADGAIIAPLDEEQARTALFGLRDKGIEALAIVLMHGWKFTAHEERLAEMAAALGFTQISVSNEVAPLIKLIGRGDTTVADCYLSPVLRRYVDQVEAGLPPGTPLHFMQSNGGLARANAFRGKDAILSGPAGGVVGMAAAGAAHGAEKLIGFDMGGTSTDVSHFAGRFELGDDNVIAGVRIRAPMMQIHTIAAGGGSVCRFDGMRFRVGPHSAGANPGPACYRGGGPLTVTDCNLFLGRIDPTQFPAVFGPEGNEPLDPMAARGRLEEIAEALGGQMSLNQIAEGFLAIAVDNMAAAIRKISIARGHDVTLYTLACFGGAGGQHACRVADVLGMEHILIHPLAGLLSAQGIGIADVKAIREMSWLQPFDVDFGDTLAALEGKARQALIDQGVEPELVVMERRARLRTLGSDTTLELAITEPKAMRATFAALHLQRFGYVEEGSVMIVDSLIAEAIGCTGERLAQPSPNSGGERWAGPALIHEIGSTVVVEPGWSARREADGSLLLTRSKPIERLSAIGTSADPVRLEIFNNLFMAIAEEMGVALQATATSVNIKERLDFSCALFDREGALIANAPHIPVHLGSMGESIRTIIEARGPDANDLSRDGRGIRRGDAYVLNDPYRGGTHLPDITVIMPVFYDDSTDPDAFVAARGHHADVGGFAPGSMPPDSRSILDEGVLIDNELLVEEGRFREAEMRALLGSGAWPARSPDRNISDLKAQLAACTRGAEALAATARNAGPTVVAAYMDHVLANAEESVRRLLGRLEDGEFAYAMDNGATVKVAIRIDRSARSAVFDFTGSSAQLSDNFNAPFS